ncbi:MAG: transcription factor E [Methanobacteriaceae archaeon]|nr:transcription factor E [Methanobacteriaceae archaeon]
MARTKSKYPFDYDSKFLTDENVLNLVYNLTHDSENSAKILNCLFKGQMTDEEISEETGIKLNFVRKILYKLYDVGIATYKRKKDPETQWFTYRWKFESKKAAKIIEQTYEAHNKDIEESLKYEENNLFFMCPNGCRYSFDEATDFQFVCPRCELKLDYKDNQPIIDELKSLKSQFEIEE